MPHNVSALPVQLSADTSQPVGAPPLPVEATPAPSPGRRRRERADAEFNTDFDELCELVADRFARTEALDPEFCRFVGLLPDLKMVKDRTLVREAKIIASYLCRDDIQAPIAQRAMSGLIERLRPLSGLPALHVTFGVVLFFVGLLVIDVTLSYFWQIADWSLDRAALYPGFYLFNVSPWLVIAIGSAGGLGSIVSLLTRIPSFTLLTGTDRRLLWMIGAMRPVIGIAFALFVFAVLQAQILPFTFAQGPQANFEYVAFAFIAGFSERLSRGVMSTVEGRILGKSFERSTDRA